MYRDLVWCTWCEWRGTVIKGSDICPNCGKDGNLAWQDEDNQEVEA